MMSNYARTQELLTHAQNSAGASNKQYEKTMESLEAKLNQLKNAWDTFTMDIARSDLIKGVVDLLTNILTAVNNLTGALGSFSGVAKLVTAFVGFKLVQPIITGLTSDMIGFAKTLAGTGEAQKGFEKGLVEGFKNLREKLFDKKTWIYEGEKAGEAAGKGVKIGVEKAAQEINAAQVAKESLTVQPTISKESLDSINKYQDALKKITEAGTKFNGQWQQSGETLKNLAKGYTKNGEAIKGLTADNLRYFKYYRSAGIPVEESFIAALDEQAAETIKNVRASNMLDEENQKLLKSAASAAFQRNLENKTIQKNTEITQGNTFERKENATVTEEQAGSKEANIGATETENKVTEESTRIQGKNNKQTELGILTKANYYRQLLFTNGETRESAASALEAATSHKKFISTLASFKVPAGVYVLVLAAALALTKSIAWAINLEGTKLAENAKAVIENTNSIKDEITTLKEQEKAYQNALSNYDDTIESKKEYREATLELADALGEEIKASDILSGNTEKINKQLIKAELQKRKETEKTLKARLAAQETLLEDSKNKRFTGFYRQTGIGILQPLDSLNAFMYNLKSYDEYVEQEKEAEEGKKETLELLQKNLAEEAILQAREESSTKGNLQTYESYLNFRTKLNEKMVELGATEADIQQTLSELISDTEYKYEITYEAQKEFSKNVANFGEIDTTHLDEFLDKVEKAGDTSLLVNINLLEASEVGLEKAYENAKNLSTTLKNLTLGDSFLEVGKQLAEGVDFDSLSEDLKKKFNNELSQTKGLYNDIISAQEEWNNLLSDGGTSKVKETKYVLQLSKKALENQKKEAVNAKDLKENREAVLKEEKQKIDDRSKYSLTPFSRLDFSGKPLKDIFSEIEKKNEEYIDLKKQYDTNVTFSSLSGGDVSIIKDELDALKSYSDFSEKLSDIKLIFAKYTGSFDDFTKYNIEEVKKDRQDLIDAAVSVKSLDGGKYYDKIIDVASQITDVENYLKRIEEYNKNEADLLKQFESIDLSDSYNNLRLEELAIKEAKIDQAVFSKDNLSSFYDLKEKVMSGDIPTKLDENVENILSEIPSITGGYADALEEWEYFTKYLRGQQLDEYFAKIEKAIEDKSIQVVQNASTVDRQSLDVYTKMIPEIESKIINEKGLLQALQNTLGLSEDTSLQEALRKLGYMDEKSIEDLEFAGDDASWEKLKQYAKDYANALTQVDTITKKLTKSNYGLSSSAETIGLINANIDNLGTTIETLSDLLSKIGEDFTLSAEDAREFAKVFPEILESATVAADGTIQLNEGVVQNFIDGKKKEVVEDAQSISDKIDNAIKVIEAQKEINLKEKENFKEQKNDLRKLDDNTKEYLLKNSDILYTHIKNSGAQEVADTIDYLNTDINTWNQYLNNVTTANKQFYENLLSLKKLSKLNLSPEDVLQSENILDFSGKVVGVTANGQTYAGNDMQEIFSARTFLEQPNISYLDKQSAENIAENVNNEIDETNIRAEFERYLLELEKTFDKTDENYNQQLASLKALKISLNSIGATGSNLSIGKGITSTTETSKFENTLDKLYNLLQNLEALEYQYNELLKKRNVTGKEIYENLKAQIENLQEQQKLQKQIAAGRQNEISQIFKNTSGLSNYASYDTTTGVIQVNQSAINSITDKDYGDKILAAISDIESAEKSRREALNSLSEISDKITEIKENGINKYVELENRTLEALKQNRQTLIDNLSEINSSINEANSRLMETIRDNINKLRQDRQNEKTEKELSNLQGQLAAMAARTDIDTSTNKEYLDLQKNLKEKTESYQDTLVDQKLATIEEDNKKAQEQRETQIKLLTHNLEVDEKTGILITEVQKLITAGIDETGKLIKASELTDILKAKDSFEGLSAISKMQWLEELEKLVAEGYAGIGIKNQLENRGIKSGTKINFTDGSGALLSGVMDSNGNVKVTKGGKTYTYSEVFRNEAGQYETFETQGTSSTAISTATKTTQTSGARSEKDYYGVALATINGSYGWGSGEERTKKYKEKGFDPQKVQSLINTLYYDSQALSGKYYGIKDLSQFDYKKYLTGGLANYTGLAWLDGTKSNPEAVLNSAQTKAFINLVDNYSKLREMNKNVNVNNGQTVIEVNVHVDKLTSDYDVDQVVNRVKETIYNDSTYRTNNVINYLR